MKTSPVKITVLGAGAMGSALASLLSERNAVNLWGSEFDVEILNLIKQGKEHPRIEAKIPKKVKIFYPEKLKEGLEERNLVILGVSTEGVEPMVERIKPYLSGREILMSVTKGLIQGGKEILSVSQYLEKKLKNPVVSITGPSIAKEVVHQNFTRVVFASEDLEIAEKAKRIFETDYYFVETSQDPLGAELVSVLKNIYSITLGWPKGMATKKGTKMDNLTGILMTQALREMATAVRYVGGKEQTAYGLAGLGDVVCTAGSGRNGMLGELLGEGKTTSQALEILRKRGVGIIEGYQNCPKARDLLKEIENDLPLFKATYQVLYQEKEVGKSLKELMVT